MKVKQFFLSFFTNTGKPISDMCGDMLELRLGVKNAAWRTDAMVGVVELFNTASQFEDKHDLNPIIKLFESVNYGQHDKTIIQLKKLKNHLLSLRKYNNQGVGAKLTTLNVAIGSFSGMNAFETYRLLHTNPREIKVTRRLKNIITDHALQISAIVDYLLQV